MSRLRGGPLTSRGIFKIVQSYPEKSIQDRQERSFTFSAKGCELKAESGRFARPYCGPILADS